MTETIIDTRNAPCPSDDMPQVTQRIAQGLRTFAADVANGFMEVAHNGFALIGMILALGLTAMFFKPELRAHGESTLRSWLIEREVQTAGFQSEPDAIERATATNPRDLPKEQAAVAFWISKKYRVAPEPISALVAEAYEIGHRTKLDPTLILAIMAIESGFNPFAQSPVGAQGLMQVMTKVHTDKFDGFGGQHATFDPLTNLKVGVKVLQECVARAGSVEGGLRQYVGATSDATEGGYAGKVLAEQQRLLQVAAGRPVPLFTPPTASVPAPVNLPTVAPAQPQSEDKMDTLTRS